MGALVAVRVGGWGFQMDDEQMDLISMIVLASENPTQLGLTEGPMHPDEVEACHHQID